MCRGKGVVIAYLLLVLVTSPRTTTAKPGRASESDTEIRTPWGFSCVELGHRKSKRGHKIGGFLAREAGMGPSSPRAEPVYISQIEPGTPAALSKLRVGDRLLYVSGFPVMNLQSVEMLRGQSPGSSTVITVQRAGQTIQVDMNSPASLRFAAGCVESERDLVGAVGLPITAVAASSEVQKILASAGMNASPMFVIKVNGAAVPAPHLSADGSLADETENIRMQLSAGSEEPFSFQILSGKPNTVGCEPWKEISFKAASWHGGITVGSPEFVRYIGGRIASISGNAEQLSTSAQSIGSASSTLDYDALGRLSALDREFQGSMAELSGDGPKEPTFTSSTFPRYTSLRDDLDGALAKRKMFWLKLGLEVVQRASPSLVLAQGFYGSALDLGFCDDGVCHYSGQVFIRLSKPTVANMVPLAGIWLQYSGLKTYTTVLGAPETVPEFFQADLGSFPDVRSARDAVANFVPTEAEKKQYVEPVIQKYEQNLAAYYQRLLEAQQHFLQKRLALLERIAKPIIGAHVLNNVPTVYGSLPQQMSPAMVESLPTMLTDYEGKTKQLTREIQTVAQSSEAGNIKSAHLLFDYTQAWIQLSMASAASCAAGAPLEPWCDLQSWTRIQIPALDADGKPIAPNWWQQHRRDPSE